MSNVKVEVNWYVNAGHEYKVVVETDASYSKFLTASDYVSYAVASLLRRLSDLGIDFHIVHFRVGRVIYRDKNDVHTIA